MRNRANRRYKKRKKLVKFLGLGRAVPDGPVNGPGELRLGLVTAGAYYGWAGSCYGWTILWLDPPPLGRVTAGPRYGWAGSCYGWTIQWLDPPPLGRVTAGPHYGWAVIWSNHVMVGPLHMAGPRYGWARSCYGWTTTTHGWASLRLGRDMIRPC